LTDDEYQSLKDKLQNHIKTIRAKGVFVKTDVL
jgi:hypothetical protein